jgi:hypothetical protein
MEVCRCGSDRSKDKRLTPLESGQALGRSVSSFALLDIQKSAEAIVVGSNEP